MDFINQISLFIRESKNLLLLPFIIFEGLLVGCDQRSNPSSEPEDRARPNIIFVLTRAGHLLGL